MYKKTCFLICCGVIVFACIECIAVHPHTIQWKQCFRISCGRRLQAPFFFLIPKLSEAHILLPFCCCAIYNHLIIGDHFILSRFFFIFLRIVFVLIQYLVSTCFVSRTLYKIEYGVSQNILKNISPHFFVVRQALASHFGKVKEGN